MAEGLIHGISDIPTILKFANGDVCLTLQVTSLNSINYNKFNILFNSTKCAQLCVEVFQMFLFYFQFWRYACVMSLPNGLRYCIVTCDKQAQKVMHKIDSMSWFRHTCIVIYRRIYWIVHCCTCRLNISDKDLERRIRDLYEDLVQIWKGTLHCDRHQRYMKGGSSRSEFCFNFVYCYHILLLM